MEIKMRIIIIGIIIAGAVLTTLSAVSVYKTTITRNNLQKCEEDSECIIVPYSSCCGSTKKAINKDYLDEYNSHPSWQKFEDPERCALMGFCGYDSEVTSAKCDNGGCVKVIPSPL